MKLANFKLRLCAMFLLGLAFGCKRNEAEQTSETSTARSAVINNFKTFDGVLLNNAHQGDEQNFKLPDNVNNVKRIMMYVRLDCADGNCPEWDVYANVLVKNKATNQYYEMGRYITPYKKSNAQLERGFAFDVTDFKSLLNGDVNLKVFTENWGGESWKISVDFDYEQGTPDYPYYAVLPVMQFNGHSLAGVPYGVDNDFKLKYKITIPSNAEQTSLRTIISGWGHADNRLPGGNCAEWCPRIHHVWIDNSQMFQHELALQSCQNNKIDNQSGNWVGNRAGWCPGMEVPTRVDVLTDSYAGKSFDFEYKFQPWTNTLQSSMDNKNAYYAISTFVVVKSNFPINSGSFSVN